MGSIKRSRYSLDAVFPDEGEKTAFTQAVESQLPTGYSLFGDQMNTQAAGAEAYAQYAQSQEDIDAASLPTDNKQVYLVPDESTAGVTYFAYFVDENRELQPLIYDVAPVSRKGEKVKPVRFFPSFDESDIESYRTQVAADRAVELKESNAEREKAMDVEEQRLKDFRERPGIR